MFVKIIKNHFFLFEYCQFCKDNDDFLDIFKFQEMEKNNSMYLKNNDHKIFEK